MRRTSKISLLASLLTVSPSWATKPTARPTLSTWVVYWDTPRVLSALHAQGDKFQELALFAYHFTESGQLIPADVALQGVQADLQSFLQGKKVRVLTTIVNDLRTADGVKLKDADIVHIVIASSEARHLHVQEILKLTAATDGVDIDYERIKMEDGPAFQLFIEELAEALHEQKKWLSIVVQPRWADAAPAQVGSARAMDWKALSSAADEIKVMAYLEHFPGGDPGSLASLKWVRKIAAYGLQNIPPAKFCVALHTGGFDWAAGQPAKAIEYRTASTLVGQQGVKIQHDPVVASAHFSYKNGDQTHEVWMEDGAGIREKIQALRRDGVQHIALWRLGSGDPSIWSALQPPPSSSRTR